MIFSYIYLLSFQAKVVIEMLINGARMIYLYWTFLLS